MDENNEYIVIKALTMSEVFNLAASTPNYVIYGR